MTNPRSYWNHRPIPSREIRAETVVFGRRAGADTMWETGGVVRDQVGLQHGLDRVAELRELARDVDARPSSERNADLAHALDLRTSLMATEATPARGAGPP
jgi:succinate dehydrogenase/fumarate reductase flavoprotein subunit